MFNIALAIANEYNLIKKAIPKTGKSLAAAGIARRAECA